MATRAQTSPFTNVRWWPYLAYAVRREVDPRPRILPPWERKPEEYGPAEREELNRKLLEALGVLPDAAQHARARRRPPR